MPTPGWGAVVQGEPGDLADWARALKEPSDPWVEVHGNETVLRSASLNQLTSSTEVRDRSIAQIEQLNGAMALSQRSRPLRFGGVIQFTEDGRLHQTIFVEMAGFEAGDKMHAAILTVSGPNGEPVSPSPPQPSEVQRWAAIADQEDLLHDALVYFGRIPQSPASPVTEATDWFDIYKALECLEKKFGGNETAFRNFACDRNWAARGELELLKRTANWARHARRKFDPPPNPMGLKEARDLLGQLLRRALEEAAK
jgi:hypothetical protein